MCQDLKVLVIGFVEASGKKHKVAMGYAQMELTSVIVNVILLFFIDVKCRSESIYNVCVCVCVCLCSEFHVAVILSKSV